MKNVLNHWKRVTAGLALSALSFGALAADNVTFDIDWSKAPASQSQFALPQPVSISSAADGSWSAGGARSTWSLTVTVPGAISTSFAADQVKLPAGTTLTLQGNDGIQHPIDTTLGASGKLWSDIVQGDTFTLVASVPTALAPNFNLHLIEIQGGYQAPFAKSAHIKSAGAGQTENYACVQDATNIYAARATAAIVVNNTSTCTGSLVNDGAGDFKPYFLTASHCAGQGNLPANDYTTSAQSIKAYWGAQTICGQTLGYAVNDATAMTTGATHRVRSGDVWLVELAQTPPADAYYEGFDASGGTVSNVYGVHHAGALDRQWFAAAVNNNGAGATVHSDNENFMVAGGQASDGTFAPGASGGGVVNASSQRLLGVLHSGSSATFTYATLSDVYASGFSTYLGAGLTTNGAEPPPAPPAVTLTPSTSSVTVGTSISLTWSTTSVSNCTASASPAQNDWTGSVSVNGSASVTPAAVGSVTYTLSCTGTNSSTVQSQTVVQVNAAGGSGGTGGTGGTGSGGTGGGGSSSGGGAFGLATLIPMLLVGIRRKRILGLRTR